MRLAKYLGKRVSCLLEAVPFKGWPVERWVDEDADPPCVYYEFQGRGLQVCCDREEETVNSVFLKAESVDMVVVGEK